MSYSENAGFMGEIDASACSICHIAGNEKTTPVNKTHEIMD
jgi:hypothetical protein